MPQEIVTIAIKSALGGVNCYLVKTGTGYVLVDTGVANKRAALEAELAAAGCTPGGLALVVITHGDFDHTGNAAYLREKFGARIAMHRDDAGMAEFGNMFWNRKAGRVARVITRGMLTILGFGAFDRFRPDIFIEDGDDLSAYGFAARVLHIPGHSKGSIGILTADGDLFCGDLLANTDEPKPGGIMDDPPAANASVARLRAMAIRTVYPGHGRPFPMELL